MVFRFLPSAMDQNGNSRLFPPSLAFPGLLKTRRFCAPNVVRHFLHRLITRLTTLKFSDDTFNPHPSTESRDASNGNPDAYVEKLK